MKDLLTLIIFFSSTSRLKIADFFKHIVVKDLPINDIGLFNEIFVRNSWLKIVDFVVDFLRKCFEKAPNKNF